MRPRSSHDSARCRSPAVRTSEAALVVRCSLDRREPAFESGDALGRARRAPRGVEHRLRIVGVHHGDLRGIHPERLGLERHGGQGAQPLRLRDDVGRHEDHTASSGLRGRDGAKSRARPGEQQSPSERQPCHHRVGGDVGRRARGHDHEKALRHRRDPARDAGLSGNGTPPRLLDSRARCSISQQRAASARLASACPAPPDIADTAADEAAHHLVEPIGMMRAVRQRRQSPASVARHSCR